MKQSQIGGKGTIRQKKKNISRRKTDLIKFNVEKTTTEINTKLTYLGNDKKKILTDIINKDLEQLILKLQKNDLKNIKLAEIKLLGTSFFHKLFFYIENSLIILLKEDIHSSVLKYFTGSSQELCFKFIFIINDLLVTSEKKLEPKEVKTILTTEDKIYNPDIFKESLAYFKITTPIEEKIHFTKILKQYNETEKKIEDNFHFQRLKAQYENYLKSFS